MITKEGVRADPEKVQAILLNLTLKSLNQIRNLFLQLTAISKFIPKLAELKNPIREVQMRLETAKGPGWTNKAKEALRWIKRKLWKLQTLAVPKEGEDLMLKREGVQIPISYVKVVTDGPMEEILNLSEKEGPLAKWAAEIRTYDISYIPRKEAEGSVVKKFSSQGEQVQDTLDENEGGTLNLNNELQAKSTLTPRAWSPEENMHSYAIRLKLNASDHVMDCEALLAGLAASANQGLATIKLEFFNQEVLVGIKTRPSVEKTSSSKKGKATSNMPSAKPNYNWEVSGSN
ncbi:hypothetical protein Tco_1181525 [Tanacetum coccineum]